MFQVWSDSYCTVEYMASSNDESSAEKQTALMNCSSTDSVLQEGDPAPVFDMTPFCHSSFQAT